MLHRSGLSFGVLRRVRGGIVVGPSPPGSCFSATCPRRQLSGGPSDAPGALEVLVTQADYERFKKDRPRAALWFTATWCPPCRRIAPVFEALAKENKEISFAKIDIDANAEAAKSAAIMSVPTFMLYRDGQLTAKFTGADQNALEQGVAKLKES